MPVHSALAASRSHQTTAIADLLEIPRVSETTIFSRVAAYIHSAEASLRRPALKVSSRSLPFASQSAHLRSAFRAFLHRPFHALSSRMRHIPKRSTLSTALLGRDSVTLDVTPGRVHIVTLERACPPAPLSCRAVSRVTKWRKWKDPRFEGGRVTLPRRQGPSCE